MFTLNGVEYSIEELQSAAKKANMEFDAYLKVMKGKGLKESKLKATETKKIDKDATPGKDVGSDVNATEEPFSGVLKSEEVSSDSPIIPSQDFVAEEEVVDFNLGKDEKVYKKDKKEDEKINDFINKPYTTRVFDKDTELYRAEQVKESIFSENDALLKLKKIYKGSGLTFEYKEVFYAAGQVVGKRLVSTASLNGKTINIEAGGDIESQKESRNKLEKLIRDNKKAIDFSAWNKERNALNKKRDLLITDNPDLNNAILENKKNIKDNKDLFTPYEETKKTRSYSGGSMMAPGFNSDVFRSRDNKDKTFLEPGDNTVTKTIYPYEKELKKAEEAIRKANDKLSPEDVRKLAEKHVRAQLYDRATIDAKNKSNEALISSGKISKEEMYASNLFLENDNAKNWNENTAKGFIANENMVKADINLGRMQATIMYNDGEKMPDQQEIIRAAAEFGIVYKEDLEIVKLQNGRRITKGFYNLYKAMHDQADASRTSVIDLMNDQRGIIDSMKDIKLSMTAASKSYSLADKYATNIALGVSDIVVGGLRIAAEGVNPLHMKLLPDNTINFLGGEYSKFSQELRQSFVGDVSFEDKFSSGANFGKFIMQEMSTQIPFFAAIALSGGTAAPALIGITSAGKKLNDMSYEMSQGGEQFTKSEQYLKALGYGLLDAADVAIGKLPLLKGAKARWIAAGQKGAIDTSAKAWMKTQSLGFVEELITSPLAEMGNTGGQNLIDGRKFTEGMDHAGFSAFGFSLLFAGTPYFRGLYNSSMSNYNSLGGIRKSQEKIDALSKELKSARDLKNRALLKEQIKTEIDVRDGLISSNEKLINNSISEAGAAGIIEITSRQSSLQNQANDIINDKTKTDKQIKEKLADVNAQFMVLENIKQAALSNESLIKNEVEFKAFKALNKQAYDQYIETANQQLVGENDGKSPTKDDTDRRAYNLFFGDKVRESNKSNESNKNVFDGGFKSFETKAEAVDYINKQENLTPEQKQKSIEGIENGNDGVAFENPNGLGEITLAVVENQVLNQRRYIRTHEVGHQAIWGILKNAKNESGLKAIANQLLFTLEKQVPKAHKRILDSPGVKKEDGSLDSDEVIARFLEEVAGKKVGTQEKARGLAGLFGVMVQKQFANEYKFDFKGEEDIFNFVVGLGQKISNGTLTLKDIKDAQEGALVKDLISKQGDAASDTAPKVAESKANKQLTPEQDASISIEINDLQTIKKENKELAAKYGKEPIKGGKETRLENKILESINPIIGRIVTDRTKALYDPIAVDAKKGVSRQDFQESMRNDIQTMVIEEFNGKQDLEKFIINRSFLRANNLAQRLGIQSVEQGITKGLEAAEKVAIDETKTADKDVKLTKATKILSEKQLNEAKEIIVKAEIKDKDLSYKKLKGLTAKVVSEVTGIPEGKISNPSKNLSKPETTTAAMFIEKNVDYVRRTLPEGAVLEGASKNLIGTSTGVPQNILDAFYVKGKRGDNLAPFILRKGLTNNEILEAIGRPKNGKPTPIDPRSPKGSVIKGIIDLVNKNITNELVRTERQLTIQQQADVGAGRSKTAFSDSEIGKLFKDVSDFKPGDISNMLIGNSKKNGMPTINYKYTKSDGTVVNRRTYDTKSTQFKALVDTLADFFLQNPLLEPHFRTGMTGTMQTHTFGTVKLWDKIFEGIKKKNITRTVINKKNKPNEEAIKKALKNVNSNNKAKLAVLKDIFESISSFLDTKEGKDKIYVFEQFLFDGTQDQNHPLRYLAPFNFYPVDPKTNKILTSENATEEHANPAVGVGRFLLMAARDGRVDQAFKVVKASYMQGSLLRVDDLGLKKFNLNSKMPDIFYDKIVPLILEGKLDYLPDGFASLIRYSLNNSFDPFQYNVASKNITIGEYFVGDFKSIKNKTGINLDIALLEGQKEANKLITLILTGEISIDTAKKRFKKFDKLVTGKVSASKSNNSNLADIIKYSKAIDVQQGIDAMAKSDKALDNARRFNEPIKKIRVFDFDDTLAKSKSEVLVTMPGENVAYNASPKTFDQLGKRTGLIFLATDIKEAQEYAKSNRGEVRAISVNDASLATEDQVLDQMNSLNINTSEGLLYEMIDSRFEDFYIGNANLNKLKKALKQNGFGGFKYNDGSQISSKGTESIAVIDKSIIKEPTKINATEFAEKSEVLISEGAKFDFSEFSKVMDGKKGPLFDVAKKIQDARGSEDIFILTARPADAAGPIKEFLNSIGLDVPLKNITGLGDGSPQAKAGWVVGKASEGYNDFYFADDATGNVKAVKDALSVLDVKSKVQQAKIKFSENIDLDFNRIIENSTGIAAEKNYAKVKARLIGKNKGKFDFFIPPSAEDFVGLLYKTLGKGKIGDSQMKWYKDNLLDPYARAIENITRDRNTLGNNFRALKRELNVVPKDLKKKFPGSEFTKEQGVRVYIWDQIGKDIPGLSKADLKELTDIVKNDAELELFAQEVMKLNKGTEYVTPSDSWITGTITTDLAETLNTTKRKQYLEQWQQNVDIIFSEKNLNKMEAAYGRSYRDAMENILGRMEIGTNRTFGGDTLTGRFTDWLNGSTAAIMFFNSKSAILQTISSANFINFGDNNILAAGKAFANQPQYWKDFSELFNSDFLVDRRDGLKININEADIADVAKESGARGVINKLLKLGFLPTQVADSFAIASGGATFYRNRVKSLMKEQAVDKELTKKNRKITYGDKYTIEQAEKIAMRDFREVAEESQQSSRPDKISSQQAGPLGRIVLAFANTPAQYARLIKKAASDLKNGRGDAKSNISKIMYYGVVQNLIFNALQQALFAVAFEDEEEVDDKTVSIINGMADSILRGTGIGGAIFSVVKNAAIKIHSESEKKNPKYEKAALELLKISPPISSKINKITAAGRSFSWNMDEMKNTGFSLDNPAYLAVGNTVSAATNIPLDRVVKKLQHLKSASDAELETYKRMALAAGWSEWELGIEKNKPKSSEGPGKRSKTRSSTRKSRRRAPRRRN